MADYLLRTDIDRKRHELIVFAALLILERWYGTWEMFSQHRHGAIRRMGLQSKCYGLVYHDRALAKAEGKSHG